MLILERNFKTALESVKDKNPFREDNWEIISKTIKYNEIKDTVAKASTMALGSRTKDDFDYENFSRKSQEKEKRDPFFKIKKHLRYFFTVKLNFM